MKYPGIHIILVYFGPFPMLTDYFFLSCHQNPEISFLLFTDQLPRNDLPENIQYISFSSTDFEGLVKNKLGLKIKLKYPYKLCDFKPLYGHLFEDYLAGCAFWGYCDMDLIFGNIMHFLSPEILNRYDIITAREKSLAGNFTLYRNKTEISSLYNKSDGWSEIMQDQDRVYGFDEYTREKGTLMSSDFFNKVRTRLKKPAVFRKHIPDMNTILDHNRIVKVWYGNFMRSDEYLRKRAISTWSYLWKNGKLRSADSGEEIMYFHFYRIKNNRDFSLPPLGNITKISSLLIHPGGIELSVD